jgi:KUP system potassium uptake protein
MATWKRGRDLMLQQVRRKGLPLDGFIRSITEHPPMRVPGVAIFLTASIRSVPQALLHNLKHNKVLHEYNVILTVETVDTPEAAVEDRGNIERIGAGFYRAIVRFGFAEDPEVLQRLSLVEVDELRFDPMSTTFFVSRETAVPTDRPGMMLWRDKLFAYLARNAQRATTYFAIPGNRLVEIGTRVEI